MHKYKLETEDLAEKVYKTIKQMILKRQLVPGQKLIQEDMAKLLGVSRTPLLTAFSKLEKEWLVESRPRRGYCIRELSLNDELSLFDIRMRLEPLGAKKAAENGTPGEKKHLLAFMDHVPDFYGGTRHNQFNNHDYLFHGMVMEMSRNIMLAMMLSSYNIISLSNQDDIHIDFASSVKSHKDIARAIAEGNGNRAEESMFNHIKLGQQRILDQRAK